MLLDPSWENSAIKRVGSYNSEEYLMGVKDFQQKVIEDLEYKIILSEEIIKKFPLQDHKLYQNRIETLKESIKIIKNLKK